FPSDLLKCFADLTVKGGVRLSRASSPRPASPLLIDSRSANALDDQPGRAGPALLTSADSATCQPSIYDSADVTPASYALMSHHDLAIASLCNANRVVDIHEVRQAITGGFYYVRDWKRLKPDWTLEDSNLECPHIGLCRGRDGIVVEPPSPVSHMHMFGQLGVLFCEDGRSPKCRLWHRNLIHCHLCDTYACKPCLEMHLNRTKANAKHRTRPANQKRKAARAAMFEQSASEQ
ncbi:unnamed protein product, partial [Aureobasidium vineae]